MEKYKVYDVRITAVFDVLNNWVKTIVRYGIIEVVVLM